MSGETGKVDPEDDKPQRRRRLGARTFGMLLCAWIWTLLGIAAFGDAQLASSQQGVIHLRIPGPIRAAVWFATAGFAAATAWSKRGSTIALGLLWIMPAVNLASYLAAWVISSQWIPGGGYPRGWYAAAFFLALVGLVVLAAMVPARPSDDDLPATRPGEPPPDVALGYSAPVGESAK